MKVLLFSVCVILLTFACNDPNVVDPVDNDPVDDPMDSIDMDPVDTKLLEIKEKWEGDYVGTVTLYQYYPNKPSTYDTLYDQKILINDFSRDSLYPTYAQVSMIFNNNFIDSSYYGAEAALLSDSAVLIKPNEAFSNNNSKITLNHVDSTLIRKVEYFPLPNARSVLHGIYKRQ